MHRIVRVGVLKDYRIDLHFADGTRGIVDLSALPRQGVLALWNDYAEFEKVRIGDTGELAWSDQVDLCPDALYLRATGRRPEEVFPGLRRELAHA